MAVKLLKCIYCKGDAELLDGPYSYSMAACKNDYCGAQGPHYKTADEAAKAWNIVGRTAGGKRHDTIRAQWQNIEAQRREIKSLREHVADLALTLDGVREALG